VNMGYNIPLHAAIAHKYSIYYYGFVYNIIFLLFIFILIYFVLFCFISVYLFT
jgi:fumarate reductase subunit D